MKEATRHDVLDAQHITLEEAEDRESVNFEKVLETIDGDKLQSFLSEQLKNAGLTAEQIEERFVKIESISVSTIDDKTNIVAHASGNNITFIPKASIKYSKGLTDDFLRAQSEVLPDMYEATFFDMTKLSVLHTLVHEELHALTAPIPEYTKDPVDKNEYKQKWITKTGVRAVIRSQKAKFDMTSNQWKASEVSMDMVFDGINEGLTELMAQQLTKEFHRQSGGIVDTELAQYFFKYAHESGGYRRERWVVEQWVAILSEMVEVPDDIMLKSFFVEYISNGNLVPPEFEKVLLEYVPTMPQEVLEEFCGVIRSSFTETSFTADSEIHESLKRIMNFLPKEKADRCRDKLAEILLKYYPSAKYE